MGLLFSSDCHVDSLRKLGDGNLILLYRIGFIAQLIKTCFKIAFRIGLGKGEPLKQRKCSSEFISMVEITTFTQFGLMRSDLMLLSGWSTKTKKQLIFLTIFRVFKVIRYF